MMRRRELNPETYRKAAIRYARCRLRWAGVPGHCVGFSHNAGYYLVLHAMIGGRVRDYTVPCAGARVLAVEIERLAADWRKAANRCGV